MKQPSASDIVNQWITFELHPLHWMGGAFENGEKCRVTHVRNITREEELQKKLKHALRDAEEARNELEALGCL